MFWVFQIIYVIIFTTLSPSQIHTSLLFCFVFFKPPIWAAQILLGVCPALVQADQPELTPLKKTEPPYHSYQ